MTSTTLSAEIAQPYAQALLSIAQTHNLTEEFGADARTLIGLLTGSQALKGFLANPLIKPESKQNLLGQITGESANQYLHNFLSLLVHRRRIEFLEVILRQYLVLLRQLNQTVLAEVTSAVPLTEAQQQTIVEKVIAFTGARQVEVEPRIDRELIGGVVIKVGSQVIDASLRGQLRRLSLRLSSN
jgi:F-type H+-transporting ATPase subunit delta